MSTSPVNVTRLSFAIWAVFTIALMLVVSYAIDSTDTEISVTNVDTTQEVVTDLDGTENVVVAEQDVEADLYVRDIPGRSDVATNGEVQGSTNSSMSTDQSPSSTDTNANQSTNSTTNSESSEEVTNGNGATVSYIAAPGDSKTMLVRQTVLDYLETNDMDLSAAQIVYVETNIVDDIGRSGIDIGEQVTVDLGSVSDYVAMADDLTPSETAAWQYYANQTSLT